jgi:CheY-like chemotaxis protein
MEKKKIVIVDDEANIRLLVKRLLGEDYIILEASDGEEAINIIRMEKPDLILMDIKMPVISGRELYHHIEAMDSAQARRVMFITGDVMEATTRDFLDETGAPYIAKPFNIEHLKNSIARALTKEHIAAKISV